MTISGIFLCILATLIIAFIGFVFTKGWGCNPRIMIPICAVAIIFLWGFAFWYFNSTASGRRAVVDQQAELNNGLDRTINVYTADGDLIATYEGRIDLEDNEGGYVIFDYNGKRYTYYNCFVESIAEIN